jgi:hypothetical protein
MSAVTRHIRGARRTGQRVRMRSSEAPVRISTLRLSALRLPFLFGGSFRAVAWQSSDAKSVAGTGLLILTREAGEGDRAAQQRGGGGAGLNASLSSPEFVEMKRVELTLRFQRKNFVESRAPSTILRSRCSLRMVPSPACASEDEERAARMRMLVLRHCERSEAIQCGTAVQDCVVASLLAMTAIVDDRAGADDAPPIPWRDMAKR